MLLLTTGEIFFLRRRKLEIKDADKLQAIRRNGEVDIYSFR